MNLLIVGYGTSPLSGFVRRGDGYGTGMSTSWDSATAREVTRDRRRRRSAFLRELDEARELRKRIAPHRERAGRQRAVIRMRRFWV